MIAFEESIPTKSTAYRKGLDIFYVQFNDVFFYIEDDNQENFYFCILKKLFPDILLEKIFPLGGKENVIEESGKNDGDRTKIYLLDKDFDDIFQKIEERDNLFYLERYSVENYLIEEDSFTEYIIGEKPRVDRRAINSLFDLIRTLINIGESLRELIYLFLVVQTHNLGLKNVAHNHERFIAYNGVFSLKEDQYSNYKSQVQSSLKRKNHRYNIDRQIQIIKKTVPLKGYDSYITHIPGKYVMKMIKLDLEHKFHLASRDIDSFNYRIADNCSFDTLATLRDRIRSYLN